jgi:predicted TIM-barrel fold metal-dependent hydrolase
MAPYMMGRVDTAFKRYAKEWDIEGGRIPSEAYKENVYIDTLSMHVPAIKCAYEYMGVDHLLFGTDYPGLRERLKTIWPSWIRLGFLTQRKRKFFQRTP